MKISGLIAALFVLLATVSSHRTSHRTLTTHRRPSHIHHQSLPRRIIKKHTQKHKPKQVALRSTRRAHRVIRKPVSRRPSAFLSECLTAHNRVRRAHNLPLLVLDPQLTQSAQRSADYIASRPNYVLDHNYAELAAVGFGENLTRGYPTCQSAVNGWAGEVRIYNAYNRPAITSSPDFKKYGHYTQLVWRTTSRVGCAMRNSNSGIVIVCRYDPAGNRAGEKPF